MRNKKISHPIYRTTLYLYPKAYRREYGEQMVQTLQDMLDDNESSMERVAIWLRITTELPLSVLKENINNIGEGGMGKLVTISNKRLVISGISIVIAGIIATVGLWRNALVDGVANVTYGSSLRTLVATQNRQLGNPFTRFAGSYPKPTSECAIGPSNAISMHVDCEATAQTYVKLGQSSADKTKVLDSVQVVSNVLKAEGYQSGSNGVTLTSLVTGTYVGKDYSPDAFYQKVVGADTCVVDTVIAYANPAQPAINMNINCDHTVNIFGKPSGQMFDSSKGFGDVLTSFLAQGIEPF